MAASNVSPQKDEASGTLTRPGHATMPRENVGGQGFMKSDLSSTMYKALSICTV